MVKRHPKRILLCLILSVVCHAVTAQVSNSPTTVNIISYIQQLETAYDVRFSYVDEDLRSIFIRIPSSGSLAVLLSDLEDQTQLLIKKLNPRYYTISRSATVSVCGFVLDNFEDNTVTGATVEVLGSDRSTVTGSDGSFYLPDIPRKASLRIQHLGYKTRFVSAEELLRHTPCETILLGIIYQQLDEVIVFKFLTPGLSRELDASILLNTKDFGILPGLTEPDVLQTVQALPGIESIDETVSDINIRGGTHDQNLILWDGIKMYQSGHFFGLISAFNPYLTDKVSLIKNGTSAEYGDGVSGIIDMRTKDLVEEQFFGGGGFNLISGDFYGHTPISERLALQFSGRRSVTDFLNTPTYQQFRKRVFQDTEIPEENGGADGDIRQDENFYFYDFTAKLLYDINESHKARMSFIQINNSLDYTETAVGGRSNESTLDQTNFSFGAHLESGWTGRFKTLLNTYYTRYNLISRSITANGAQQLMQKNMVDESSFRLNTLFQWFPGLTWLNGYQGSEVGINNETDVTQPEFNSTVKGVIRTHAVYSELGYISTNQKLRIKGGARLNYMENPDTFSKLIPEPRLNINYTLTEYLRLEALGEFKSQTTNQVIDLEQNFLGIEKRRWVLSDDNLLPITRSKQGSLGLHFSSDNWYASGEGFYKRVEGISTSTQGFQNQNQFDGEIGSYDVKGAEAIINYKSSDFSTWLSYTHNVNNYNFPSLDPGKFPNNQDIRHTVTFASTYSHNDLKLGIGINYRSGKPYTEPQDGNNAINTTVIPNEINYTAPNSSRLPDYFRADFSAIYDFVLRPGISATAGLSLLNVLNRENILNRYYRLNDMDEIETVESFSLGRTPNISFRVTF